MQRRQASYIRREDHLKRQIEELQQELAQVRAEHNDGFLEAEKLCDASLVNGTEHACIGNQPLPIAGLSKAK